MSGTILFYSCTSQSSIFGKYRNKKLNKIEWGYLYFLKGIKNQCLDFLELKSDSTFYAPNCRCESKGIYTVKKDSLILFNETKGEGCKLPITKYKITKNNLIRKGEYPNSMVVLTKKEKRQNRRFAE
ncbi:MAG: hypothetical protein H6604_05860 [Flavobacteriales bacterium]|nr:hypothetical protein [Flavobacteriales bacterium]